MLQKSPAEVGKALRDQRAWLEKIALHRIKSDNDHRAIEVTRATGERLA